METLFDFLAVALFVAAAATFFHRLGGEDPPLAPYMLIALVCAVSNWLGNNGGGVGAVLLMAASSFFLLHLASQPYAEDEAGER